jgi:hypothetical protein
MRIAVQNRAVLPQNTGEVFAAMFFVINDDGFDFHFLKLLIFLRNKYFHPRSGFVAD